MDFLNLVKACDLFLAILDGILSMFVSEERQIGVNPVLFDAIVYQNVWCALAVFQEWKQTNVRNKRKIFCLVPRSFFYHHSSINIVSRAAMKRHEVSGHMKFQMKEKFFNWFPRMMEKKVSAFKGKNRRRMKCGGLMMFNKENIYDAFLTTTRNWWWK